MEKWLVFLLVGFQDLVLYLAVILFGIVIWWGDWWFIVPMIFVVYLVRQLDKYVTLELHKGGFK